MKSLQAGCDVSELRSTGDKPCKSILNIFSLVVLRDDRLQNRELQ